MSILWGKSFAIVAGLVMSLTAGTAAAATPGTEPKSRFSWVKIDKSLYLVNEPGKGRVFTVIGGATHDVMLTGENGSVDVDVLNTNGVKVADLVEGRLRPWRNGWDTDFAVKMPNLYGTYRVRIAFTGDDGKKHVNSSRSIHFLKRVPTIPASMRSVVSDMISGYVTRFDPCKVTTISYSDSRLPKKYRKRAAADLKWGAKKMTALTGGKYKVIGRDKPGRSENIKVTWRKQKRNVLGWAETTTTKWLAGNYIVLTRGNIGLDTRKSMLKKRKLRRAVILHELMHLAGRGHAKQSTGNIMTPKVSANAKPKITSVDKWAMNRLGRGSGCL